MDTPKILKLFWYKSQCFIFPSKVVIAALILKPLLSVLWKGFLDLTASNFSTKSIPRCLCQLNETLLDSLLPKLMSCMAKARLQKLLCELGFKSLCKKYIFHDLDFSSEAWLVFQNAQRKQQRQSRQFVIAFDANFLVSRASDMKIPNSFVGKPTRRRATTPLHFDLRDYDLGQLYIKFPPQLYI